jgi:hypothetical protein
MMKENGEDDDVLKSDYSGSLGEDPDSNREKVQAAQSLATLG